MGDGVEDRFSMLASKRPFSRQHLVKDHPE